MNTYRKHVLFIFTALLILGCVGTQATPVSENKQLADQCLAAKYGKLDVDTIDTSNKANNAYLFECAVSVVIAMPSMVSGESKSKAQRRAEKLRRSNIADKLLAKGIDTGHRNEYGDSLIMSVINSFLTEEWKEKTVARLMQMGVSVSLKNTNGDTALDIAKYKGNKAIIRLVTPAGQ